MNLEELKRHWDGLGRVDPLWAVLSDPAKRGGKWDRDEFFAHGDVEVAELEATLSSVSLKLPKGRALDFGCGVGRLTRALALRFDRVVGVDIAPSMIEQARRWNPLPNCGFQLNCGAALAAFADSSFDFVYSNLVLQNMEARYALGYVREFVRVLKPGGLAVFQAPEVAREGTPTAELLRRLCPDSKAPPGLSMALPDAFEPEPIPEGVCGVPLGSNAYLAQIQLLDIPSRVTVGGSLPIRAVVRNIGGHVWPARPRAAEGYWIRLGNRWLNASLCRVIDNDGRVGLSKDLAPGADVPLTLRVTAPPIPGLFVLELDMVHELVSWFSERGSPVYRVALNVQPPSLEDVPAEFVERELRVEMHCTSRHEVERAVRESGGTVLHALPSSSAGTDFIAFLYVVTR